MFKTNLKIAFRNIWRHKLTTSIKLVGLVVGLSTVVLLVAYVMFELSFDQHNQNVKEIYRLRSVDQKTKQENIHLPSGLANMMVDEIPELENVSQLRSDAVQLQVGENFFKKKLLVTENSFFKIFTAPLVLGDPKTALKVPNTLIISESLAKLLFPKGNALGQRINIVSLAKPYQIVGVMKDLPNAAHFHADLVTSTNLSPKLNWRGYSSIPQYIQLKKGATAATIEKKLQSLYKKYGFPEDLEIKLMPLAKIHLYAHTDREIEANSDIKYVYIFATVAFFILLIAIVNFINLTVAASLKRGKEIGVKKVMGASIGQLRLQFLSESYLYFILASILVLIFTHDLIPLLGEKMGINLSLTEMITFKSSLISLAIIIVSGFIAGLYPAIVLSKLMPVKTLKGYTGHTSGNFGFKKVLMTFQFAISAFLIVCTLLIYSQLEFIRNKNLGFDKEQLLVSSFTMFDKNLPSFKDELSRQTGIKSLAISSFDPGKSFGSTASWTNDNDTSRYEINFIDADFDFIKTLNIKLVQGRAFSRAYGSDTFDYEKAVANVPFEEYQKITQQTPIILNEAAVKSLNLKHPLDTVLSYGGLRGHVIGIVNNFNGMSLHNKVTPLAIEVSDHKNYGYLYVKVKSENLAATKALVLQTWKKYFPNNPPEMQFMDEHLEQLYQAEMRLGTTFITFAGIAIFLCCIGLFGMVYFELAQRTKEIAVRKILGASLQDLLTLLNSSFIKVVIIANILIWPIAYYLIKEWLNSFYYRIEISYLPFVFALLICIVLTLLTVSIQALKTLKKSPVNALKYE